MVYKLFRIKTSPVDVNYIEKICYFVSLAVVCVLLTDMISLFCEVQAFRHDELRYLDSYSYKLCTEGRWLNYIFFPVLKLSNVKMMAIANIVFFFIFSYVCFLNIFDKKYAVLCAMVSLFIPPVHLLNEWAQTGMPTWLLLAVAAAVYKKMSAPLFFFIFGILFNGCGNHFYFLLPLLFIEDRKNFFRIICYWCVFFVVGFIFAEFVVLILKNQFITLADWRKPNYIDGIPAFIHNLKKVATSFFVIIEKFGEFLGGVFGVAIIVFVVTWIQKKNKEKMLQAVLIGMVGTSIFALSLSAGLSVEVRSAACLFMAFLFFICISFKYNKFLLFIFIMGFVVKFYVHNMNNINYIKTIPDIWISELKRISPDPRTLSGVILISSQDEFQNHEKKLAKNNMVKYESTEYLGEVMRWAPAAYEFGFRHIYHTQWGKEPLKDINMDIDYDAYLFKKGSIYEYAIINNYLVIRVL